MEQSGTDRRIFATELLRPRETPVRLVFATLAGSSRFWATLVIGLPIAAILAAHRYRFLVPFAAGAPIGIGLVLQWRSHEFVRSRLTVDVSARTLTKAKPYGLGTYSPIDVADVARVSIVRLGRVALVRFHYHAVPSGPNAAAIAVDDLNELEVCLERLGLATETRDLGPSPLSGDLIPVRPIATPVAIVGSLVTVRQLFGVTAFATNTVVVPLLTVAVFAAVSYGWRYRLRRSDRSSVGSRNHS